MTVQDYLRVFRERWLVIAIAALIGLAVALGAFLIRPAQYTAQISMYVSAQVGSDPQQAYLGAQLSEQRVKSYTGLVTSPRVMKETISRLGLDETPEELAGKVEASGSADSIVIDVSASQPDPQRAAQVADTIGSVFTGLVDELERPAAANGAAPVAIRIVQPADVPTSPSSTGLPLTLAIGLFAGLVAGAGVVVARNALDTSLRSPADLSSVTGSPTLGAIAFDAEVPKHPLLVREDPQNPRAEAFRQVRTNLQFVDVDAPRKVLMVTSSMPGEGKSTTVANLAIALAAAGSQVLVIEADLRRPKLADLLGVERSVGLTRVLSGRVRFSQAVQPWNGGAFDVLTSGPLPPNPSELLGSRQMANLLEEARAIYDVVLVDSPPLLPVTDAAAMAPATDGAVLICRYRSTSRSQLTAAVEALRAVAVKPLGTVFTMVPSSGPRAYAQYHSYYRTEEPLPSTAPETVRVPGAAPSPTGEPSGGGPSAPYTPGQYSSGPPQDGANGLRQAGPAQGGPPQWPGPQQSGPQQPGPQQPGPGHPGPQQPAWTGTPQVPQDQAPQDQVPQHQTPAPTWTATDAGPPPSWQQQTPERDGVDAPSGNHRS